MSNTTINDNKKIKKRIEDVDSSSSNFYNQNISLSSISCSDVTELDRDELDSNFDDEDMFSSIIMNNN